jgi:hypothetical protein
MVHQLHQSYLPLSERRSGRPELRETRARRWNTRRRRLRELLRAPASRFPLGLVGVPHA